jgi:membrane protein required for beta-lactamase induction
MTILIVLVGLIVSHYFTAVGRWRNFDWLLRPTLWTRSRWPTPAWLPLAVLVLSVLIAAWLAIFVATFLLGALGWALLALATFIYTLGPRDLDRDIQQMLDNPDHADSREAADALGIDGDTDAAGAAAAVVHAGRTRWFAILFWFSVLGIPGALLYRVTEKAIGSARFDAGQLDWLARLRWVLEWPVLALMVVAIGLVTDLDRVAQAWKHYHRDRAWWIFSPKLINEVMAEMVRREDDVREDGLRRGHQLNWRVLVLWLVVLSLMLIAGWLV